MSRKKKLRNVLTEFTSTEWLLLPEKLDEITELVESRANGVVTPEMQAFLQDGDETASEAEPVVKGGIGILQLQGTIAPRMNLMMRFSGGTSTKVFEQQFRSMLSDPKVETIVISADSPGGAATGIPELASIIRQGREQKRVVVAAEGMLASAAYYLASAATEIYASRSTSVGSIGVLNVTRAPTDDEAGRFVVTRAGQDKSLDNGYEKLSDRAKEIIQERVNGVYEMFVGDVAENLGVSKQTVLSDFGQGRTFFAEQAAEIGMITGVATLAETIEREAERLAQRGNQDVAQSSIKEDLMSDRLKALLFAHGLLAKDADDDLAEAVLNTYCRARGIDRDGKTEDQLVELIGTKPTAPSRPADSQSNDERTTTAERNRILELQARAEQLTNTGVEVTREMVEQAIQDNLEVGDAVNGWLRSFKPERPVEIVPIESQQDRVTNAATAALLSRCTMEEIPEEDLRAGARDMQHMRVIDIVRAEMRSRGQEVSFNDDRDAVAWLQGGGASLRFIDGSDRMDTGGTVNRSGDHPAAIDGLVNKMLNRGLPLVQPTYPRYAVQMPDLKDFQPHLTYDSGLFGELDAISEDDTAPEAKFYSEPTNVIQAARYARKVGLTVEMIVGDNLGLFAQQLRTLAITPQSTMDRLCRQVLAFNPTMKDGVALFANGSRTWDNLHSGAAPTPSEMALMRTAFRTIPAVGDELKLAVQMHFILAPPSQETDLIKTFGQVGVNRDQKIANTDSNINTVVGALPGGWAIDSYLADYDADHYYIFANPQLAPAVGYARMPGYGPNGQRTTWFDPDRMTRFVRLEARMAAAALSPRGVMKNLAGS